MSEFDAIEMSHHLSVLFILVFIALCAWFFPGMVFWFTVGAILTTAFYITRLVIRERRS